MDGTVIDGTYDIIVPEHSQFEHVKDQEDKIQDIYSHTNDKIK